MSLIIEDGTGKVDAQSYVSAVDADAYHLARGNSSWTGTDAEKEAAIMRAMDWLDPYFTNRWPGFKYLDTQALEWPRSSACDKDGYDLGQTIPAVLKAAVCEAALIELVDPRSLFEPENENGAIIQETEGKVSKTYAPGVKKAPPAVTYPLARVLRAIGIRVVRA